MRIVDRLFSVLFLLGGVGHTLGVWKVYHDKPDLLFWSLTTSVLIALLGALSMLRSWRPGDAALGWLSTAGSLVYLGVIVCFGRLIGNMADPRVVLFAILSAGMALFGLRTALGKA